MSFQENGLYIIIFPPEGEKIAPNGKSKTRVSITNKKHQHGIRLEVSLDLKPELQKWCKKRNYNVTIGYQQSQEIEFLWAIPLQAPSGTYSYNLRIQIVKSTSFYYFKPKRRQLTILPTRVKPQIHNIEPSFAVTPASSSTKPITLSPRETLNLEIDVHNRSNRTDNLRISTDLEDAWYIIRYPETIKRVGAIEGIDALNLNPGEKGKINFSIQPPADTVAGNYKPEIKLHSFNSPEFFLKKIVYLNIPPQYLLQVEFQTILNKVSYKKGQYQIILTNQGNTFRKINLKAQSSDEDECCKYFLEPSSVRIPPNKTVEVKLEVKPNSKQKRPLLTARQFNFQVDLTDKNNHPLPKNLPLKSSLSWRSRSLWQLILLFALALGIISGCVWGIWWLFFKPKPEAKITLKPEKTEYYYDGDPIAVDWKVENPETIGKIIIFDREREKDLINTKCYVFKQELEQENCYLIDKFIIPKNDNPDNYYGKCTSDNNIMSCSEVTFKHPKNVKEYTFKLQALDQKGKIIDEQTTEVNILPRTTLKVIEPVTISPNKSKYRPTDNIELKFKVSEFNYLKEQDKISLLINDEVKTVINSQSREKYCFPISSNDHYNCAIKISPLLTEGEHTLRIEIEYDPDGLIKTEAKNISIAKQIIVQTPIRFDYFTINGKSNTQIEVEPNTPIKVRWSVIGKEVKANISCIPENIRSSGIKSIKVLPGKSQSCTLTASDIHDESITPKNITIFVKELPKPEPESEETKPSQTIIKRPFGL